MKRNRCLLIILVLMGLLCQNRVCGKAAVTTPLESLPSDTGFDQLEVTINQEEGSRTYIVYRQGGINESTLYPGYIAGHGCAACSTASILTAWAEDSSGKITPADLAERVEKEVFGEEKWTKNYSKSFAKQMPMSLYGASLILEYYQVPCTYVRSFEDQEAVEEITAHLKEGLPVIALYSNVNRHEKKHKGSVGYHTITFLGLTDEGELIIGEPGGSGRLRFSTVEEMIPYLFPCKEPESTACYFSGRKKSGGYILVGVGEKEAEESLE